MTEPPGLLAFSGGCNSLCSKLSQEFYQGTAVPIRLALGHPKRGMITFFLPHLQQQHFRMAIRSAKMLLISLTQTTSSTSLLWRKELMTPPRVLTPIRMLLFLLPTACWTSAFLPPELEPRCHQKHLPAPGCGEHPLPWLPSWARPKLPCRLQNYYYIILVLGFMCSTYQMICSSWIAVKPGITKCYQLCKHVLFLYVLAVIVFIPLVLVSVLRRTHGQMPSVKVVAPPMHVPVQAASREKTPAMLCDT